MQEGSTSLPDNLMGSCKLWQLDVFPELMIYYFCTFQSCSGQTCEIINLIHQLHMLFPSKNSILRLFTHSRSNPHILGDSIAHEPVAILCMDPMSCQGCSPGGWDTLHTEGHGWDMLLAPKYLK